MAPSAGSPRVFSFEFFPPKTPRCAEAAGHHRQLAQLNPRSSPSPTAPAARRATDARHGAADPPSGHAAAPHLSCVASTARSCRGDRGVQGERHPPHRGAARRHALGPRRGGRLPLRLGAGALHPRAHRRLVPHRGRRLPEYHPQARKPQQDLRAFKAKIDAGADAAITQYFYNADAYFHFVEQAEALGIDVPIVPGIMPINNFSQLARFSDACGAEIPRWLRLKLEGYGDDTASIKAFGLDVVTELCDKLLAGGAPGCTSTP
jgi:methylenetetrahydrofolate reductase (NADPH)